MEEALSLDLGVLEALLRRNRTSHGRTQYYKRTSMAVRALQRHFPLLKQGLLLNLRQELQDCRKQEWTIQDRKDPNAQLQIVKKWFDNVLPEILSRIQYAASALFQEIERGFFLPLCTVALGALARIRILILRMGRQHLSELHSLLAQYKDIIVLEPVWFEETMKLLEEHQTTTQQSDYNREQQQRILQSIGLTRKKSQRNDAEEADVNNVAETIDASVDNNETSSCSPPETKVAVDDIGESVVATITAMRPTLIVHQDSTTSVPQQKHQHDDSDRNLELLHSVKVTKIDRERMNEYSEKKKTKKRKKEKKDIFDQIFGDT